MRVDLKSFLLGAILVAGLFLVVGQITQKSDPIGRYQIFMPNTQSQNPLTLVPPLLLLDTKTGRTWNYYFNTAFASINPPLPHKGWEILPYQNWGVLPQMNWETRASSDTAKQQKK